MSTNNLKAPEAAANAETILIIEDDKALREGLEMNFNLLGYRVLTAKNGEEGMNKALKADADLIVLDIMLPGWSGLDILTELRAKDNRVPVLVVSARDATASVVEGLRTGADDYVTKPFDLKELMARVEVMLRRRRQENPTREDITFGDITINVSERRVTLGGKEVELSSKEFDLLRLLAELPGRPLSRDTILDRVWGWDFDGTTRTVDNFIVSLRKKLEADPGKPRHIKTVRQVGYKLDVG